MGAGHPGPRGHAPRCALTRRDRRPRPGTRPGARGPCHSVRAQAARQSPLPGHAPGRGHRSGGMIRSLVATSLKFRVLVALVAAGVLIAGVTQLRKAPVDVLPEYEQPYVEVHTESLGLSAS